MTVCNAVGLVYQLTDEQQRMFEAPPLAAKTVLPGAPKGQSKDTPLSGDMLMGLAEINQGLSEVPTTAPHDSPEGPSPKKPASDE